MTRLKPVTAGELLLEEFLIPMGLTQYRVAKEIGVRSLTGAEADKRCVGARCGRLL